MLAGSKKDPETERAGWIPAERKMGRSVVTVQVKSEQKAESPIVTTCVAVEKELSVKKTRLVLSGTEAPPLPPSLTDQWAGLDHKPVPPTQYRSEPEA